MIVVSDTSALNYLLLIGEADILPSSFTANTCPPRDTPGPQASPEGRPP